MKHTIHNVQRAIFGAVHIDTKATQQFLKGESRGKFSCAIFSTDNEDRLCKGVLNIPPLQCLSSVF